MNVKKISLINYRNIENLDFMPSDTINIIYGDNAQGKTNIIEAIWLFTGNGSFKGSRMQEVMKFGSEKTLLKTDFSDNERTQTAQIKLISKENKLEKKLSLNNVDYKSISQLNGQFFAVVFTPILISSMHSAPKNRRSFLDAAISQIKPQYKQYLHTYDKLIMQRNALLKDCHKDLKQQLEVWDIQIARIGTALYLYRKDYIGKLLIFCKKYYIGISSKTEEFNINYISTTFSEEHNINSYTEQAVEIYKNKLAESLSQDIKNGSTQCGIHRDDIDLLINDLSVKKYGSQGQQRSAVITLKLSEAALLKRVTGENPIILLDDVMSELDEKRQEYILNHLSDMQVFITCCDVANIKKLKKGKVIKIENGKLIQEYNI